MDEKQKCTAANPCNGEGKWYHPDAIYLRDGDIEFSSYAYYRCPHCGLEFKEELPE